VNSNKENSEDFGPNYVQEFGLWFWCTNVANSLFMFIRGNLLGCENTCWSMRIFLYEVSDICWDFGNICWELKIFSGSMRIFAKG
jgi:hypothetical protein